MFARGFEGFKRPLGTIYHGRMVGQFTAPDTDAYASDTIQGAWFEVWAFIAGFFAAVPSLC